MKRVFQIIIAILILLSIVGCSAKFPTDYHDVNLKIHVESNKQEVHYSILPNKWNKAAYDRPSYQGVLRNDSKGNIIKAGERIVFDFGKYKPDKLTLIADGYTNPLMSIKYPVEQVDLVDMGFTVKTEHAYLPDNTVFYVLTAEWGKDHSIEYAFRIQIDNAGNEETDNRKTLTVDAVIALANGELSPADIIRTYKGKSITSGINSFYAEFTEGYALMIGYVDINNDMYVRIIDTRTNKYFDLTKDSIKLIVP